MSGIKYARALKIPISSICQGPEFLELYSVYLFLQKWESSEYASGCIYGRVLNIWGLPVCKVSANARVTQGSEYGWNTWGNCLTMAKFWICSVKVSQEFENTTIFKHVMAKNMVKLRIWDSEYAWKNLNLP